MAQRYYEQESHSGTYVLELEGSLTGRDEQSMKALEETVDELTKKRGLTGLIIHQSGDLKIDSTGIAQIIGLCASLYRRDNPIKPSFAGLNGTFQYNFDRCKLYNAFKKYNTLEEALGSE